MQDQSPHRSMTRILTKSTDVVELFHVAPSIAIIGVGVSARSQFRQFVTGCEYLNLPKPFVTLVPNTEDDFKLRQNWKNLIHEALKYSQETIIVRDRVSSILPVGANDEHHAHFVVETTRGTFCFDDLIMDGMPSLNRVSR